MRKHLLAAAAILALGGTAYGNEVTACMRDPLSDSCQMYRRERETENRMQRFEQQQRDQSRGGMNCALYGRC